MKQRMKNMLPILLIVFCQQAVMTQAWGTLGHEIVGNLAWYRLSDPAKTWVNETLHVKTETAANGNPKDIDDPTMTPLGKVADWADAVRHYLGWSSPLHFIDVRDDLIPGGCLVASDDCKFIYERDCVNDVCVAGAILNYTKQLLSSKPSPNHRHHQELLPLLRGGGLKSSRLEKGYNLTQALMFLTHFIGDIHQPLHASRTTDKGGNDFHVHFSLPDEGENTKLHHEQPAYYQNTNKHHHSWNLHSVWDSAMIEVVLGRNYNHSRHLMEQDLFHTSLLFDSASSSQDSNDASTCNIGINATCVIAWGKESFDLALQYAYVESDNVTQVSTGSTLDELYYESRLPIIKQQLILGGMRLAETIEAIVANQKAPSKILEVRKALGLATLR
ncbi:unnamed protein product [Cylindrotheca closterium]|uniref:Aspergillus nuclease S(1) n=1 Tax=Cylindrotheca closterium TaxID=2856 RepID=A0AAD2GB79_9STRA|nr:unnamed protein product [Cylindrotheca closterium]